MLLLLMMIYFIIFTFRWVIYGRLYYRCHHLLLGYIRNFGDCYLSCAVLVEMYINELNILILIYILCIVHLEGFPTDGKWPFALWLRLKCIFMDHLNLQQLSTDGPGIYEGFVDDRTCTSYPCLIFEDNFDFINHKIWEHEITAGGGGVSEESYMPLFLSIFHAFLSLFFFCFVLFLFCLLYFPHFVY